MDAQKKSNSQPSASQRIKKMDTPKDQRIEQAMSKSIASIVLASNNRTFQMTCLEMIQLARDRDVTNEAVVSSKKSCVVEHSAEVVRLLYMHLLKKLKYGEVPD